jgi:hypothetical protein
VRPEGLGKQKVHSSHRVSKRICCKTKENRGFLVGRPPLTTLTLTSVPVCAVALLFGAGWGRL